MSAVDSALWPQLVRVSADTSNGSVGVSEFDNARRDSEFARLAEDWRPDLSRYAFRLCRDHSIAEDVVQETLMRAWRSFANLNDRAAAKAWLLTIIRREHARLYERKRIQSADIDELSRADQFQIASTDDTDRADLRAAIMNLDQDYREPLVLQALLGYNAQEAGEIMGISPGAVLTRLCRARKKLAAAMACS